MAKPLEGVVVLDLSRVLAAPYTGMILADMGADVIKIERPGKGDDSRAYGPFKNGESVYYMSLNRGKRSMTLNMKSEEGKQILKDLVKQADVLVENFRGGTMDKLGLGYDVLKEINPRLIYSACTGFGMTGPYKHEPAYDVIVQGMGGIMSITGMPGGEPTKVGASIGDITAGIFSAVGIMMALYNREKTGKGQLVDVSMLDCQVAILENAIAATSTAAYPRSRWATAMHPSLPSSPSRRKTAMSSSLSATIPSGRNSAASSNVRTSLRMNASPRTRSVRKMSMH